MPIEPSDFMDFSERTIVSPKSEFDMRNSVSRAYYGAFHMARAYIKTKNLTEFGGSSHSAVVDSLIRGGLKSQAYVIQSLCKERCHADYDLLSDLSEGRAKKSIEACKRFITSLPE